jgi:hypothetical protein
MHRADEVNNSLLGDGWRVKQSLLIQMAPEHIYTKAGTKKGRPVGSRRKLRGKQRVPSDVCAKCQKRWRQAGVNCRTCGKMPVGAREGAA